MVANKTMKTKAENTLAPGKDQQMVATITSWVASREAVLINRLSQPKSRWFGGAASSDSSGDNSSGARLGDKVTTKFAFQGSVQLLSGTSAKWETKAATQLYRWDKSRNFSKSSQSGLASTPGYSAAPRVMQASQGRNFDALWML